MIERWKAALLVVSFSGAGLGAVGCTGGNAPADDGQTQWEALMSDGDPGQIAPGSMRPGPMPPPPSGRFCPGDCSGSPLANQCLPSRSVTGADRKPYRVDTYITLTTPSSARMAIRVVRSS